MSTAAAQSYLSPPLAFENLADSAWLRGFEIVAVAVVAQAVWRMARDLRLNRERVTIPAGPIVCSAA